MLDSNGYPTEEILKKIEEWPYSNDFKDLIELVGELWTYSDYWKVDGLSIEASTGGWSGNESIISALRNNRMFWAMCWLSTERGGHYTFKMMKDGCSTV